MKKNVCDYCGKDVDIYKAGAIHGACCLYINRNSPCAKNRWRQLTTYGKIRNVHKNEGAWCNTDCFIEWLCGNKVEKEK